MTWQQALQNLYQAAREFKGNAADHEHLRQCIALIETSLKELDALKEVTGGSSEDGQAQGA